MAAQVHHHPHRNIIVIPRDIYQKCTEDHFMSRTRMVARATRARNASSQRLWNGRSLQGTSKSREPVSSSSVTSRPTNNDLVAASNHSHSTCMSHVSSPSLCSSLSSYSSSSSSYSSSTSSLENTSPSFCTNALAGNKYGHGHGAHPHSVTIGGHITTIHLRNLAPLPPKKRKLSAAKSIRVAHAATAKENEEEEEEEASSLSPLPGAKRCRENSPSRILPSITNMVRAVMPAREVIVISSDNDDDDDDNVNVHHDRHAVAVAAVTKPIQPAPAVSDPSHKYELDPACRRVVDTIFPQFEEHNKATLERAFATSRILREDYVVTRYLGSGASGFVLAAKCAFDGREVAIKVIPHTGDHVEQKVQRELSILLKLKEHENVLAFLEHFTSSLYGDIDPEDQSNKDISYIVTEMAGFSLFDFIELHKPAQDEDTSTRAKNIQDVPRIDSLPPSIYGSAIQEDALRSIFTQLALALHSLHSQSIVHGDIKDENALISVDRATNTYRAKLCDFGHSKYLQPGSSPCFSFYGTTILAPPEMDANVAARQKSKDPNNRRAAGAGHGSQTPTWDLFYGYEADVWALGLTLYTMVHGDLPKELYETDKKRLSVYKRKRSSSRMFPFTIQENIDADLKDLLKHMLAVDPSRRLSMSEVVNHPWMLK